MSQVYDGKDFRLTQAAVDMVGNIYAAYKTQFPDDPPVLVGINIGYKLESGLLGESRVIIAFWRRSEVTPQGRDELEIAEVAGYEMALTCIARDRPMFRNAVIDHSPDRGFFLRTAPDAGGSQWP